MPVTMPVDAPTVAIAGLLLLQVPPAVALLKVTVEPAQVLVAPVIAPSPDPVFTVSV